MRRDSRRPAWLPRCIVALRISVLWLLLCTSLWAQSPASAINREYPLKAAYLYNFGSYVQWPDGVFANASDPFVIGILGSDPFGTLLDEIADSKKIAGRKIVVRRFRTADSVDRCQMLFITASTPDDLYKAAIDKLKTAPVLIVAERPGRVLRGAIINFTIEDNKVRFEINRESAQRHRLSISSKLLSLAKLVDGSDATRK